MRDSAAAVFLIIVVVAGAGAGYLLGVSSHTTQTTASTASTAVQPCGDRVAPPNSSPRPVLIMQPNATAYLCVTYQTGWKGDPSYNFSAYGPGGPFVQYHFYPFEVSNEFCGPSGCGGIGFNSFVVRVVPTTVNLTARTNFVVVLYTVTALANSTGYYSNGPAFACDYGFPMVVGHSASDVNASDFGPFIAVQCALELGGPLLSPVSVSASGMGVAYLKP